MRSASARPVGPMGMLAHLRLFQSLFIGYIGAGTGSLIIQVVIAATVGGLFVLKVYWRRITGVFKKGKECGEVEE